MIQKSGRIDLFAAQVGIAGAVEIEDDVVLWGQVGVAERSDYWKGSCCTCSGRYS